MQQCVVLGARRSANFSSLIFSSNDEQVACTDSGARGLDDECGEFPVEHLGHEEALRIHQPHVVICCWMELGQDWTSDIRRSKSVREYILVGEADTGVCGCAERTWGGRSNHGRERPAYERDGFERVGMIGGGCTQVWILNPLALIL